MRVKTQSQSGATYIAGASLTFSATVTHFSCSSCHPALQPIQSASASSMPGLTPHLSTCAFAHADNAVLFWVEHLAHLQQRSALVRAIHAPQHMA